MDQSMTVLVSLIWTLFGPSLGQGIKNTSQGTVCPVCEDISINVKNVPKFLKRTLETVFLSMGSRDPGCGWGIFSMRNCPKQEVLVPNVMVNKCYAFRRVTTATSMKDWFPDAVFEVTYFRRGCTKQWIRSRDGCFTLDELGKRINGRISRLKTMLRTKWKKVKDKGKLCIHTL